MFNKNVYSENKKIRLVLVIFLEQWNYLKSYTVSELLYKIMILPWDETL